MALVECHGTEPISHEPLSQAIVGVDFVGDGQGPTHSWRISFPPSMRWRNARSWANISNRTDRKIGMQR